MLGQVWDHCQVTKLRCSGQMTLIWQRLRCHVPVISMTSPPGHCHDSQAADQFPRSEWLPIHHLYAEASTDIRDYWGNLSISLNSSCFGKLWYVPLHDTAYYRPDECNICFRRAIVPATYLMVCVQLEIYRLPKIQISSSKPGMLCVEQIEHIYPIHMYTNC